ncbi:hypothetical protein CUMW_010690 [Citrus unshiu]|nr:hypothetical protein CUMW_010690 [Citrus unshiu]
MNSANGDGFNFVVDNEEGRNNISYPIANDPFSIFVLNSQGKLVKTNRVDGENDWGKPSAMFMASVRRLEDATQRKKPICSCMKGFEPKCGGIERGNWSSGCVRKKQLQCVRISSSDRMLQELLDRRKHFNIISGISRGLLYLHRDSGLRIIHRDLKANNILLDEELIPKI